ncbi:extracellular solute-binding protein [Amycolatopsis endophytica]|uniref:Multiple sugar transport system substrate-binding protein n=1 Tax=Amycolatopsis endophytica TaxID=860233 RepID=A0A853BAD5_9PSEU|nr:extracellular solute-binding protein [Amycolatopsis endophytica]NYI91712.1 multiple sugar transport system substrate-binding protein [Amycolatopsis endophytica]
MVRFIGPDNDAYVATLARHVNEYEELTGESVALEIIPETDYVTNTLDALRSRLRGESAPDVFMSGPVSMWKLAGEGIVEPLDAYLDSCGDDYRPGDFLPSLVAANRWTGRRGDALGSGPLLEIPVNWETYNLAYLPDVLEQAGLGEPPSTWAEYFAAAARIAEKLPGVRGFAQRGTATWHTMYTGYATQVWSYGGTDFDDAGRSALASPEVLAATRDFVAAARASGPVRFPDGHWLDVARDFAAGQYGMIVDSDHYVAIVEGADSKVRGRVAYTRPPLGPGGERAANMWTWSLVMNSASHDKARAWRFIEWASSPAFLARAALEGNMNPTRQSTWDDDAYRAAAARWNGFGDNSLEILRATARVLPTPMPEYLDVASLWSAAIVRAYQQPDVLEQIFGETASRIDRLLHGDRTGAS